MIEITSEKEHLGSFHKGFAIDDSIAEISFHFGDKEIMDGNMANKVMDLDAPLTWNSKKKRLYLTLREIGGFSVMNWIERAYNNEDELTVSFKQKMGDSPDSYFKKWATLKFSNINIENHNCEISCSQNPNMIHIVELSYKDCKLTYKTNISKRLDWGSDMTWKTPPFTIVCQESDEITQDYQHHP